MRNVGRRAIRMACSALMVMAAVIATTGPGGSQAVPPKKPAPPPTHARATPAPAGAPAALTADAAEVTGFRSARFGMGEADVRNAIVRDFKLKPETIRVEDNKVEQTRALLVHIPDVLPGGGTAGVSYVFGFKSKTLIQAGLTWSKASDDKMTPEQLFSNANVLRNHLLNAGYKPDTVATNMPVNGGILMFRGSDANDRTTMLILQGTLSQGENNQRILTPTALLLFYIADAKSPDIYRLQPGSF